MQIAVVIFAVFVLRPAAVAQYVIVTNARSTIDSLSMNELQKIFKGQSIGRQNSLPLQILEYDPICDDFYEKLYGQNAYAIAKHWLRLILAGERVQPPKSFSDINKYAEFIAKNENTIGFLAMQTFCSMKKDSIKAVVINGQSYRDAKYPLQLQQPKH